MIASSPTSTADRSSSPRLQASWGCWWCIDELSRAPHKALWRIFGFGFLAIRGIRPVFLLELASGRVAAAAGAFDQREPLRSIGGAWTFEQARAQIAASPESACVAREPIG